MARVFDDLEVGYFREVLQSGKLGWHRGGSSCLLFDLCEPGSYLVC